MKIIILENEMSGQETSTLKKGTFLYMQTKILYIKNVLLRNDYTGFVLNQFIFFKYLNSIYLVSYMQMYTQKGLQLPIQCCHQRPCSLVTVGTRLVLFKVITMRRDALLLAPVYNHKVPKELSRKVPEMRDCKKEETSHSIVRKPICSTLHFLMNLTWGANKTNKNNCLYSLYITI